MPETNKIMKREVSFAERSLFTSAFTHSWRVIRKFTLLCAPHKYSYTVKHSVCALISFIHIVSLNISVQSMIHWNKDKVGVHTLKQLYFGSLAAIYGRQAHVILLTRTTVECRRTKQSDIHTDNINNISWLRDVFINRSSVYYAIWLVRSTSRDRAKHVTRKQQSWQATVITST